MKSTDSLDNTKAPRLMTLKAAAQRLMVSKSTILGGMMGTAGLTKIRPGGRKTLLIESEVEELIQSWIARAQQQKPAAVVLRRLGR
jgi:predicted DNA-binding transcriptional regulator AlpA